MRDAELAAVMRRLLANDAQVDFAWDHIEKKFHLDLTGSTYISEDEAEAIEEAQNGSD